MTLWRNTRSCHADLVEHFFDAWINVGSRPSQESVPNPVFENASVGNYRDRKPRHLSQGLRRPERRRQLLPCFREKPLPLLEALANGHVAQNDGIDDVVALMDL